MELLGSAVDPDGTIESVEWVQIFGPEITLFGSSGLRTRFDAPKRYLTNAVFFRLIARDNEGFESSDDVTIFIEPDFFEIPIRRGAAGMVATKSPSRRIRGTETITSVSTESGYST